MLNSLTVGILLTEILFPFTLRIPGPFGLKHGLHTPRLFCDVLIASRFKNFLKKF